METGLTGLDDVILDGLGKGDDKNVIREALGTPAPDRHAESGAGAAARLRSPSRFTPPAISTRGSSRSSRTSWIWSSVSQTRGCRRRETAFRELKSMGFSDARLAALTGTTEADVTRAPRMRWACALCTSASTPAPPSSARRQPICIRLYESGLAGAAECEAAPTDRDKIIILGSGPNRIGQGIEFDYCCCHAAFALLDDGYETIMVNCNPETVSTDYDTSDRLYFEPLTAEDVLEIIAHREPERQAQGRHRAVRRTDAAEARPGAGGRECAHSRHLAGRHRPRRGPRPLQDAGRRSSGCGSRKTASPTASSRR